MANYYYDMGQYREAQEAAQKYAASEAPLRAPIEAAEEAADQLTAKLAAGRRAAGVARQAANLAPIREGVRQGAQSALSSIIQGAVGAVGVSQGAQEALSSIIQGAVGGPAPETSDPMGTGGSVTPLDLLRAQIAPLPQSAFTSTEYESSSSTRPASTTSEESSDESSIATPRSVAGDPEQAVASAATTQVTPRMELPRVLANLFPAPVPDEPDRKFKATELPRLSVFYAGKSAKSQTGTLYVRVSNENVPAGLFPFVSLQNFISWAKGESDFQYQKPNRSAERMVIPQKSLTAKINELWSQVTPKGRKPAAAKSGPKASTSGS